MGCVAKRDTHRVKLLRYFFKHGVAYHRVWLDLHFGRAKDALKVFFVK
jgi:hypothetical protein